MKINSLVEFVHYKDTTEHIVSGTPRKRGDICVVRGFLNFDGEKGLYIEEVVHEQCLDYPNIEIAYQIEWFREVQPPMSITELVEECMLEPCG